MTVSVSGSAAVALLAEGVDRNRRPWQADFCLPNVALLAEGVDRNQHGDALGKVVMFVALLAEGVDRNNRESCSTSFA